MKIIPCNLTLPLSLPPFLHIEPGNSCMSHTGANIYAGSAVSAAGPAAAAALEQAQQQPAAATGGAPDEAAPTPKAYDPSGDGGRATGDSQRSSPTSDSDDGTETMHR